MSVVILNVMNADGSMGKITVDPSLHNKVVKLNPKTISSAAFFARFTDTEHTAIWIAAASVSSIGVGLVLILSQRSIDLTSIVLKTWMDVLVTANAITSDRKTTILVP